MQSTGVFRNKKGSEMDLTEPRLGSITFSLILYICFLLHLTTVREAPSSWECVTPGYEDINQAPIDNWRAEEWDTPLQWFQRTLCSWKGRGGVSKQPTKITLDFTEFGNESHIRCLSFTRYEISPHQPQSLTRSKAPDFCTESQNLEISLH